MQFVESKKKINLVEDSKNYQVFEELCLNKLSLHTRGFIKIQDGCENFCSYCAIPYSRGPIKSRNPVSVINEVSSLIDSGVKEIILSGINTGTYGKDLGSINLAKLIEKIIVEIPNLYRLRLSSIELMEITDELLDVIAKYPEKIARHLHIPLQSGSNGVLKRMERKYSMEEYFSKIDIIKNRFADIAITTDCLAGFVGETIEEFEETCESFRKIGFAESHIFPYSIRPNTKAYNMPNHLKPEVIKERAHKLQSLAKELSLEYKNKFIGKTLPVLFEQLKKGYWHGHTSNYLEVKVKDQNIDLTNKVVDVKLINLDNNIIIGKEVK
jgi:threonylcarbamoyladenosine tRNA methylthiotransferase MtaB